MYKLYMKSENGKIKFYSQEGSFLKPISKNAFYEEIKLLDDNMIEQMKDLGRSVEITMLSGQVIEFDKCPEFTKLSSKMQKENIQELADKYPKGYKPRVNRSKSKNIGKRVASFTLAGGIILTAFIASRTLAQAKEEKNEPEFNYENITKLPDATKNITYLIEDKKFKLDEDPKGIEEVKKPVLELSFEYKPDGKYESTKDYYGDIIDAYCKKYGFTGCENIIYSQITQERPLIGLDGVCNNPCQLTNFVGVEFSAPLYNENGPTGEIKYFKVTEDMINNIDSNLEIGIAYLRHSVNENKSLLTGLFCYNQGPYALGIACDYYNLDKNLYMGDENTLQAREVIVKYFEIYNACKYFKQSMDSLKGNTEAQEAIVARYKTEATKISVHGDPNYLENVFAYLPHEDRENMNYEYYLENELKTIEIVNTLEYNRESGGRSA